MMLKCIKNTIDFLVEFIPILNFQDVGNMNKVTT